MPALFCMDALTTWPCIISLGLQFGIDFLYTVTPFWPILFSILPALYALGYLHGLFYGTTFLDLGILPWGFFTEIG